MLIGLSCQQLQTFKAFFHLKGTFFLPLLHKKWSLECLLAQVPKVWPNPWLAASANSHGRTVGSNLKKQKLFRWTNLMTTSSPVTPSVPSSMSFMHKYLRVKSWSRSMWKMKICSGTCSSFSCEMLTSKFSGISRSTQDSISLTLSTWTMCTTHCSASRFTTRHCLSGRRGFSQQIILAHGQLSSRHWEISASR